MIDEIQLEAEEHMTASVEHTREQLVTIRTGRANPTMFNGLVADTTVYLPRLLRWLPFPYRSRACCSSSLMNSP